MRTKEEILEQASWDLLEGSQTSITFEEAYVSMEAVELTEDYVGYSIPSYVKPQDIAFLVEITLREGFSWNISLEGTDFQFHQGEYIRGKSAPDGYLSRIVLVTLDTDVSDCNKPENQRILDLVNYRELAQELE